MAMTKAKSKQLTHQQPGTGAVVRTVYDKLTDVVSVKDFGALGDGTGRTPNDTGVDISIASWNTWSGTPFLTNPSYTPPGFMAARAKPFLNTDTWDYIGCNLALWYAGSLSLATYFPAGTYVINLSGTNKVAGFNGLIIMKGQEQMIFGDGPYKTTITSKENAAFFAANNVGTQNYYSLFCFYRTGGPPSGIRDIGIVGPNSYSSANKNLTLILSQNINGVTFRDLWLSVADIGIEADTSSGDSHAKGITTEYCFSASVYTDSTSEITIDFCNFWASATIVGQTGVTALGRASVTNSRLIGFYGSSINAVSGIFSNNYVNCGSATNAVVFGAGPSIISDNQITGSSPSTMVTVSSNASIVGNVITNSAPHACLNLGPQTTSANTATNLSVVGNTFIKTDATSAVDNYAIIAVQSGSSYTAAATASCLIANNTFQGRALNQIGNATLTKNTFDGVLQTAVFNESVTTNAALTANSTVTMLNDVLGKEILTGTGSTTPFTVTMSGILGQGSGDERSQRRLNLVAVYTSGPSHVGHAYALYTSEYNGNAILIATLGSSVVGGSIVFGVSGVNPTATVVNSGGTVTYKINSIPLI